MRIKRYVADTVQQAVAQVKQELGKDALILHSRSCKEGGFLGFFAKKRFEVLAAVDENLAKRKTPLTGRGYTGYTAPTRPIEQRVKVEMASDAPEIKDNILPEIKMLRKELGELRQAIEGVAKQVQTGLQEESPPVKAPIESLQSLPPPAPIRIVNRPTVVVLVGPTGVGKTTTIAKLAANFALFEGKSVGLVTIDTYRIAAVEQLKTYAEIINLPIEVVYTVGEFKRALNNLEHNDLILVDTAGRSQKNRRQIKELKQFLAGRNPDETHLVLSANTKLEDLMDTAESFKEVSYNRLVFTKLDETNEIDTLLRFIEQIKIPISYVTTGQSVPEDIEVAVTTVFSRFLKKEYSHA